MSRIPAVYLFSSSIRMRNGPGNAFVFVLVSAILLWSPVSVLARSGVDTLYPVLQNGKWGYINQKGKVIIPFSFDQAGLFKHNRAIVTKDKLFGVINEKGKYIVAPAFDFISDFDCVPSLAIRGKEKYMLFPDGKEMSYQSKGIISVAYCHENLMFFRGTTNLWGLLDSTGSIIVQPSYEEVRVFREHLASVKKNGKWGYINSAGKPVVPCMYRAVEDYFFNGLSAVQSDSGWFVIDSTGRRISDFPFTSVTYRYRSFTGGTFGGKMRFISREGNLLFPDAFDSTAVVFVDHLESHIPVRHDGLWGYVDHKGRWIIPPKFEEASGFYGYWAEVRMNGRAGIIGTDGHFIVSPQYESCAWLYPSGIVKVRNDDQLTYSLIDTTGKLILPMECERFYYFEKERAIWAVINDHWILYNEKGEQLSQSLYYWGEPLYSFLPFYTQPHGSVNGTRNMGYMNASGRVVWQPAE